MSAEPGEPLDPFSGRADMILDLEKLAGGESLSDEGSYEFRDFQGEKNTITCNTRVTVQKSGELYDLEIQLYGRFTTFCHRCLDPVDCSIETQFNMVVQRGGLSRKEEFSDSEEEFIYVEAGTKELSIRPQIHENLVVNIPMRILCMEDCKGLCSECGANLNRSDCSCKPDPDPRWNALRKLKDGSK